MQNENKIKEKEEKEEEEKKRTRAQSSKEGTEPRTYPRSPLFFPAKRKPRMPTAAKKTVTTIIGTAADMMPSIRHRCGKTDDRKRKRERGEEE